MNATGSKPFKLDQDDWRKIGNSAMLALAGIAVSALTLLQQRISEQADANSVLAVFAGTVTPFVLNLIRKWTSDNTRPTLPPPDMQPAPTISALTPEVAERVMQTIERELARERAAVTGRSDPPPPP